MTVKLCEYIYKASKSIKCKMCSREGMTEHDSSSGNKYIAQWTMI